MLTASWSLVARRANPRRSLAAAAVVLAVAALLLVGSYDRLLRIAGRSLVAEDPLAPADAIVVTSDARQAGVLEAADLVRQGIAPRVALLAAAPDPAERELARRGVAYEDAAALSARYLTALGVTEVEAIADSVDGTHAEARVLRAWCARRQYRVIVVVSSADHSRRLRRVLQRSMRDSPARVLVRSSRFSHFDPDSWWLTRTGIRAQIVETEKLLLDIARHPWS